MGGTTATVYVQAVLTLGDRAYDLQLRILVPQTREQQQALRHVPSLLGRDVLSRFALFLEERRRLVLLLEPHEPDELNLPA